MRAIAEVAWTLRSDAGALADFAACPGDIRGCAMFGQAHEFGERVPARTVEARELYLLACELAGDAGFDACTFALEGLEQPADQAAVPPLRPSSRP